MEVDARNMMITTQSAAAGAACRAAMENYIARKSDVVPQLLQALEHDPECALAHALMGLMMHGARHQSFTPKVQVSLEKALQYSASATQWERYYVSALEFAAAGKLYDSVSCFERILETDPTDAFAVTLCQAELFWLGDMQRSLQVTSSVASHWNESIVGYSDFLAVHAFDLEEAGRYKDAEVAGRRAVEMNPENIWATHAVAHVLYMQDRSAEGIDWISSLQNNWSDVGQMQFHLWWHKSLFLLEKHEHEAILEAYDAFIRNRDHPLMQSMPDLYIDLQNGASMLWRLEQAGVDVDSRWVEMAELVRLRTGDFSNPFTSAHFAVILAAVGDFKSSTQLIEQMRDFASVDDQTLSLVSRYQLAAIPAAVAAVAHRRGEYQKAIDALMPARQDLWMMGGSHAQQDLFFQILVDSAARLGQIALVNSLLLEIEQIGFVEPSQRVAYAEMARLAGASV